MTDAKVVRFIRIWWRESCRPVLEEIPMLIALVAVILGALAVVGAGTAGIIYAVVILTHESGAPLYTAFPRGYPLYRACLGMTIPLWMLIGGIALSIPWLAAKWIVLKDYWDRA